MFCGAKRLTVIGLILFGSICNLIAQKNARPVVIGESVSMDSRILGEKREILIYYPQSYDQATKKYSVLYLLDAEYQFHYATGVVAFLSEIGVIPEMIVVGIANTDRNRDLTPEPGEAQRKRFPTSGGADQFIEMLDRELIPYVGAHCRVQPFKILAGWSLGGLFAVHSMLSRHGVFDAYIAMSPSLYWNSQREAHEAEKLLAGRTTFNKSLYMTMGDERAEMVSSSKEFSEVLAKYPIPDFAWKYEPMADETHASIKLKSLYNGLEYIFSDLKSIEKITDSGFADFIRRLDNKYGYRIKLSEDILFGAYTGFWESGKFEDAVDVVNYFANEHPESFSNLAHRFAREAGELMNKDLFALAISLYRLIIDANDKIFGAHKGLGDAYQAAGQKEAALEAYKNALRLRPDDSYIKEQIEKFKKKNQSLVYHNEKIIP